MAKKPKRNRIIPPLKKSRNIPPPKKKKLTNGQAGANKRLDTSNRKIVQHKKQEILKSLAHGSSRITAHNSCGVAKDTFYRWLKEPEFLRLVAQAEMSAINAVDNANHTQALKPGGHQDRKIFYSRKGAMIDKLQVTGAGAGPIQTAPSPLNDDELRGMTDAELERLAYGIADTDSE